MFFASITLQGLVLGTQILLVAVALYFVATASKIYHLAVGAIGASAAYALFWALGLGWGVVPALLFALVLAALLGVLSAYLLEPFALRQEPLLGLMLSFGMGVVLEALISIIFGTDGKSLYSGILQVVDLGFAQLSLPGVITIALGLFLAIVAWLGVSSTTLGRLLRSIAENTPLAISMGINGKKTRLFAHIVAALIAAVVLILIGWNTALVPLMGFDFVIAAFLALIIGGADLRGTIIASYLIALLPTLMIGYSSLSENWRLVMVFVIAMVVLAIRPSGLFSKEVRPA